MGKSTDRASEIVKAVRLLRKRGINVGFPMKTASGGMLFAVGENTLTADQILELFDRRELHPEGVRRLVEGQPAATPLRKKATSA